MARVNWSLGEEPVYDPDQFKLTQTTSFGEGHVDMPPLIAKLSGTLRALREAIPDGLPVLATDEALQRQEQAARAMRRGIVGHKNFRVLEPAITRLTYDTMRKVSALAALWRGSTQVELIDSLVGIDIVEFWYNNLFLVVEQISQSHFERMCSDIEAFIDVQKGSTATRRAIFNQFKNTVQKSSLEIDARLDMLLEAGRIVKEMGRGSVVKYRVNK